MYFADFKHKQAASQTTASHTFAAPDGELDRAFIRERLAGWLQRHAAAGHFLAAEPQEFSADGLLLIRVTFERDGEQHTAIAYGCVRVTFGAPTLALKETFFVPASDPAFRIWTEHHNALKALWTTAA